MIKRWYRILTDGTVFQAIPHPPEHPNQVLAAYFHRSAFTLYVIYFCWALASIPGTMALLQDATPDGFQTWFSFILVPVALLAAIGALFFPHTGRFELYGASALVVVISMYIGIYIVRILDGSPTAATGLILALTYVVVPTCRAIFIYQTLVRNSQANDQGAE